MSSDKFNKEYTKYLGSSSITPDTFMPFFGYSLTVKETQMLRSSATPRYDITSDGKLVKKDPPIGSIYAEGTGLYRATLERKSATPKQLELEEKFIQAMGNHVLSDNWIWNSPKLPRSAAEIYESNQKTPGYVTAIRIIVTLLIFIPCLILFLTAMLNEMRGIDVDNRILLSLLGMAVAFPAGALISLLFDRTPAWGECSQAERDKYNRMYLNLIERNFPKEAADILKEYAIMERYVSLSSSKKPASPTVSARPGWRCSCGRENAPYVSTCTCGVNKLDMKR